MRIPSAVAGATGDDFAFSLQGGGADADFPWTTYKVEIPVDQIAWQATLTPTGSGEVDLYLREGKVPNATNADGLSEIAAPVTDSVTQAPPR